MFGGERSYMGQTLRFQRRCAGWRWSTKASSKTRPGSGLAWPGPRPWIPRPQRCCKWRCWWPSGHRRCAWNGALAGRWRGASADEIADVLLAIAPVAGLGRVVCAAPDLATALGYDIAAALEEPDDH